MESSRKAKSLTICLFHLIKPTLDPIKENDQRRNRRRGQKVPVGTFIVVIKSSKLLTQNKTNIDLLGLDFNFTVDFHKEKNGERGSKTVGRTLYKGKQLGHSML